MPDLYIANDFGHGHLLYNVSTPGHIKFTEANGERTPDHPEVLRAGQRLVQGHGRGLRRPEPQRPASTSWSATSPPLGPGGEQLRLHQPRQVQRRHDVQAQPRASRRSPRRPQQYGLAWTGWGWDVKMGDFLNNGQQDVVQADGFVKGNINRWPWLQEMAMMNDDLLTNPAMWPNFQPGDDVVRPPADGLLRQELQTASTSTSAKQLGLAVPTPTRGMATGRHHRQRHSGLRGGPAVGRAGVLRQQPPDRRRLPGPEPVPAVHRRRRPAPVWRASAARPTATTVTVTTPRPAADLPAGRRQRPRRLPQLRGPLRPRHATWARRPSPPVARHQRRPARRRTLKLTPGTHTLMLTDTVQEVPQP